MLTPIEMEDVLKNLDRRVERIEQILPTLATKEDLKAYATKEDLKAFATKEDLKVFSTKEETKVLFDSVRAEMRELFDEAKRFALMLHEQTREDIQLLAAHLADISQRLPPRA